jgi:cytochrome c1
MNAAAPAAAASSSAPSISIAFLIASLIAWLCGCSPAAPAAERGRLLAERYHCGSCHALPDVPAARGTLAPSLEHYGRRSYIAGRVPNTPATLARWIAEPQAIVPGTAMPDMGVSDADARDLAAYLGQLR